MEDTTHPVLPPGVQVFERGWLSSNSVLLRGAAGTALIDSGYHTHAPQTLALLAAALHDQPLQLLLNTHLHSDHCGGNAALQSRYPALRTLIPPGQAAAVRQWDAVALSYIPTGQHCPPFRADGLLQPGTAIDLGDQRWQVLAAPGHDPHSVILWEPGSRTLVSADALWEQGFGVVFPELDGDGAFAEVAATLDLIASLRPRCVIPGHGAPFVDVQRALDSARSRLAQFVHSPAKHLHYAAKVLVKFKLLEVQALPLPALHDWAVQSVYLCAVLRQHAPQVSLEAALLQLVHDLERSGAARLHAGLVYNL